MKTPILAVALTALPVAAQSMATGLNGYSVSDPLLTVGETLSGTTGALNPSTAGDYTPVGILDGLGAYELSDTTVRVFCNHELRNALGHAYQVGDGNGGTFTMTGARISYFDIDKASRRLVDAGLAYNRIVDANGNVASDTSFLLDGFDGISRFCSGQLCEAGQHGFEDTIYFAGQEDGGNNNPIGGAEWALDVATGDIWQIPAVGRGGWENVTLIDTNSRRTVGMILSDDTAPFDADDDGEVEAGPLYLYVGVKCQGGNFLERNGLARGKLYVWVANSGATTPLDFRGSGSLRGRWVQVNNRARPGRASRDGSSGFDQFGYPTQRNLWTQAEALGAFGFARLEDVSTNPENGFEIVLASTGVDTYAVDPSTGDGADTFGTTYSVKTHFGRGWRRNRIRTTMTILYDGDADVANRALRSPDNLDWADDGFVYIQEDRAERASLSGEPLFGKGATNPNEAGVVRLDPSNGNLLRVANIDRSVVLDGSLSNPANAVDRDAGDVGAWESSGILDVSTLFGVQGGTLFLFDVQAHGIEDQDLFSFESRIVDSDLVEGGQLLFLSGRAGRGLSR